MTEENDEKRRATYGVTPEFPAIGLDNTANGDVNDVKTKRNLTKDESIRIDEGFYNHFMSG